MSLKDDTLRTLVKSLVALGADRPRVLQLMAEAKPFTLDEQARALKIITEWDGKIPSVPETIRMLAPTLSDDQAFEALKEICEVKGYFVMYLTPKCALTTVLWARADAARRN